MDTENNRLRAELQAVNKQCQKLRAERDAALESSYEATERAIALEKVGFVFHFIEVNNTLLHKKYNMALWNSFSRLLKIYSSNYSASG